MRVCLCLSVCPSLCLLGHTFRQVGVNKLHLWYDGKSGPHPGQVGVLRKWGQGYMVENADFATWISV